MNDLIRRQDAIDAVHKTVGKFIPILMISEENALLDCVREINQLPSAQQWIPCSERMPECDYTDVLICVHDKRKGCENDFYVIQAYTVGKHWEPTLAVDMTDFDVVAWMQLPEPYEGGTDDKNERC